MIFAAGLGTRMRPLTTARPKPLIPVAGRALIDITLDHLRAAGVRRAVVNTHYLGDQIAAHLGPMTEPEITLSPEATLLETGGGLRAARAHFTAQTIFAVNPDVVWSGENPFGVLRAAWDPARMDALLLLAPKSRVHGHLGPGDFHHLPDGRLARRGGAASANHVYISAQIIKLSLLDDAPEGAFSVNVIWDQAIARQRLFGVEYPGHWADIGRPEAIAIGAALLTTEAG